MEQVGRIVLVVDDDRFMLAGIEATLRRSGYSPITATGPSEALKKSREFSGEIDLLLTDITMPEMDGLTLAERILAERKGIRVLLISGLANRPSRLPFLRKPFRRDELLQQIAKVLVGPPPVLADVFASREPSRDSMVQALEAEVAKAERRFLEVSRGFLQTTADVPSGIPSPDGVQRLQVSAQERQRAFDELRRAREKLASHSAARRS